MIKVFTKHLLVRYIISGGTSATVNLSIFALFFYVFQIHYIVSNVIAFSVAFGVSLVLQKFWTFRDHSTDNIHIQGLLYLFNSLFGLVINTTVLYICVDFFGVMPIIGVIIAGISTALCTFQISRRYVFNQGLQIEIK
jgi:putative flippase GtrA